MKRTFENPTAKDRAYFRQFAHEPGSDGTTIVDIDLEPGGGNGLHYHRTYDETFECLAGELSVQVGRRVLVLRPGERAVAPRRTLHRFFNASGAPARFRVTIAPGHAGFEDSIRILYSLAAAGLTTPDGRPTKFWQLGVLMHLSESNVPGIFRLLQPLLHRSARRALADGRFDRELRPYLEQQ